MKRIWWVLSRKPLCAFFVFAEEPDAGGDLGVGEQLAWKRDHAFDTILCNQAFADFSLIVGVGAHRAVSKQ